MPYKYKFIPPHLSLVGKKITNPKTQYTELFQQTLDEQFYNASNWWTIQEETSVGSKQFLEIDVRIAHVINAETGLKLGDDWKTLLFKNVNHPIEIGKLYSFDENMWLTVNLEVDKNLTGTCTIRRCNNTLRWIDETTGAFYEEPCCIEPQVKEPRNYATAGSPFMTPGGFLHIESQLNVNTNKIKENQRFLFGNEGHWTAYKVIGTGLNDFKNTHTFDNSSAQILTLDLVADFVNEELDDIINGIGDVNTNLYTVSLSNNVAQGAPLDTIQLLPTVTYNGLTVEREMEWVSSDVTVATVNSSGLVTLIEEGNVTITCYVKDNPANDVCEIEVTITPTSNYDIVLSPNSNYILEGSEKQYSVYLYENGVQLMDWFTIECLPNSVNPQSYLFETSGGNTFKITNKQKELSSHLTVTCTSGIHSKSFDIFLRGGW